MSFLSKLILGSSSLPLEAVGTVIDKVFSSDEERLQAKVLLEKLNQHPAMMQVALNKLEAKNSVLFVSGWRPWIGWVCGLGLANAVIINPWLQWLFGVTGPQIPLQVILELIIGMLGLGTLRTIEKLMGKAK